MIQKPIFLLIFLFSFSLSVCSQPATSPKREFRGAWVATVANIDWPSKPGLSTQTQKDELIRILDDHQKTGINAIMFYKGKLLFHITILWILL
jgi:uncharacterized lipoprotein YddW (UPF0748 family)